MLWRTRNSDWVPMEASSSVWSETAVFHNMLFSFSLGIYCRGYAYSVRGFVKYYTEVLFSTHGYGDSYDLDQATKARMHYVTEFEGGVYFQFCGCSIL